jgi:hypothetical protein
MADLLPLAGLVVGITAERRADEQARLFADRGPPRCTARRCG